MVASSAGLRPESDCSGKAQKQLYSKLQARSLVREYAPYQETRNRQTEKKSCHGLQMGARHQDRLVRLTVGRKLTSTSTSVLLKILDIDLSFLFLTDLEVSPTRDRRMETDSVPMSFSMNTCRWKESKHSGIPNGVHHRSNLSEPTWM
jgi:hypothetical protein